MDIHELTLLCKTDADIPEEFCNWLGRNLHVWTAFEAEALRVIERGFKHYSSRTILYYLRHYTAVAEDQSKFKLTDRYTPYLSRLFALVHPEHKQLFSYHTVTLAKKEAYSHG